VTDFLVAPPLDVACLHVGHDDSGGITLNCLQSDQRHDGDSGNHESLRVASNKPPANEGEYEQPEGRRNLVGRVRAGVWDETHEFLLVCGVPIQGRTYGARVQHTG
jgi:hypothetical protein